MKTINDKLPMLISVPHGGMTIPEVLQKKCLIDPKGISMDGDTWARELYDFRDLVEEYVDTDIARLVVDMNRNHRDLPPSNPDGVVKTMTVDGKQIWVQASGLSQREIQLLIQQYHGPYHERLQTASKNKNVLMGIDCHTMLDIGPAVGGNHWEERPLFCIGNRGTKMGNQLDEPTTAPRELLLQLQKSLEKEFRAFMPKETQQPLVTLNTPFSGGYITYYHGNNSDIPWIQLEINRKLYLPDDEKMSLIPEEFHRVRLNEIRDKLYTAFKSLF
ncbi:N-formylglutamate amidohydrolase [Alkaliphilus metalliredigens QYMF]|uniref:N-formylglutamate amidohydrolase n=1 Tax=Alkaliphilus metalliredigens (strain QYMF) TaxID=293826 RepID=A6TUJ4_ALKMQ|nr:N-formylglutamate amidohydrolase [Alkaliphilus metalliredigens]ABR49862.1 N-formylglutamate amidohydrolase [Alkaliphilus metalliredigens QYMF]